jgi:hypothetical protein
MTNVFVLALTASTAAKLHNDAHIVKMPQEGAQILTTAIRLLGIALEGRQDFNPRSPWVRWAASHPLHMQFIYKMTMALFEEYTKRYNKSPDDPHDIKSGNMERIKEVLDSGDFSQCINKDLDTAPDALEVLVWDSANTNRARNKAIYEEMAAQEKAKAEGVNRRKRKISELDETKELDLAETNLPMGLKSLPLLMDKHYYVRDDDGKIRGIDSYKNYYLHAKLRGPFVKKTMHTYGGNKTIPEEFDIFMRT